MDIHKNARLTPKGREAMDRAAWESGLSKAAAARQFTPTAKTAGKWVERFRAEGGEGLHARASKPHSSPSQTASAACASVAALRRQRYTGKQIARKLGISLAAVGRLLRRLGLNRLSALEPAEPVRRCKHARPGGMIHIGIKKLGRFNRIGHRITGGRQCNSRGAGWEHVHVAISDHSRIAFAKVIPNEKKEGAAAFLKAAAACCESPGIKIARALTGTGSCCKSFAFRRAFQRPGLRPIRTRPYTPKTNGKAARFIKPACGNGLMPKPAKSRQNEKPSCLPGCVDTIGTDHTPDSMIQHPSVGSV